MITQSTGRARRLVTTGLLCFFAAHMMIAEPATAYILNRTVPDKRNAANASLGACPQLDRFNVNLPINRRWNTTLNANVRTAGTGSARTQEVEQMILDSFQAWRSVSGTTLQGASFGNLTQVTGTNSCNSNDGLNTICFAQTDTFASGVLAVTRTVTSDILGEQFPATAPPSAFVGQILDADVLFNPNSNFSTPAALGSNPGTFDMESIMIHELGHFFGFSHSGVWRAMMYPFAPPPGQFVGDRPTAGAPDAPLSDDDRTGLRVLYPDPNNGTFIGSISGRILPANPLSLAGQPAGVTGIFGAHVVALDDATGAVIGATLGGWSCSGQGPTQFDGTYIIERLPVGRSYRVYVEPLDGPVDSGNIQGAISGLCRNSTTDSGWPAQFACTTPPVNINFTTRVKP